MLAKVFDRLRSKDVVTWNAMLAGYAQHGLGQDALALYEIMQQAIPSLQLILSRLFVRLLKVCGQHRIRSFATREATPSRGTATRNARLMGHVREMW